MIKRLHSLAAGYRPEQRTFRSRPHRTADFMLRTAVMAALYYGGAKLGMLFGNLTFWPPSGIVVAAVLLFGWSMLPGAAIGSVFVNISLGFSFLTGLGVGGGDLCESIFSVWLLTRFLDFHKELDRPRDIISLILVAGLLSPAINGAWGALILTPEDLTDYISTTNVWRLYLIGGLTGVLLLTPPILLGATVRRISLSRLRWLELAALTTSMTFVCLLVFGVSDYVAKGNYPLVLAVFPFVMWAGLRFGQWGATFSTTIIASLAIWAAKHGDGPLALSTMANSLIGWGIYVALLALTGLLIATTSSAQKRAQQELRLAHSELIAQKNLLQDMNASLKNMYAVKTRFLAAASHDLRQPIQAAALFIDNLTRSSLSPNQQSSVNYLSHSIESIRELLDSLLDISKLDAGTFQARRDHFGVHGLFTRLEAEFAVQALAQNLALSFRFPKEDVVIASDANLVMMVMRNLLSNALKYTLRGGVLVGIRQRGSEVVLQVWDSGIGIEPDQIDRIYDEFYQIHNPSRDRSQGLGLGLSIAQRAANLINAPLECRSRIGLGSLFCLTLAREIHARVPTIPISSRIPEVARLSGKRVVVVEDDVLAAHSLILWLQEHGCYVRHFATAEDALPHPDLMQAEIVISDYRLPCELDGLTFLERVRAQAGHPIRGIILTGDTSPEFIAKTRQSDFEVIFKPVHPEDFIRVLAR
jgi:signal transduction histidine kinase